MKQLRRWLATEHGRKMFRYAMVSVVSVPVGSLGIVLGDALGMSAGWAGLFGNSLGAIPSYWLNRAWVWGKGGRSHLFKEILPFWGLSLLGVAFGSWFVSIGGTYARHHHITGGERSGLLVGANLLGFGILWIVKYVIFESVLFGRGHTPPERHETGLSAAAGTPEL